jgi:hypothetical protein
MTPQDHQGETRERVLDRLVRSGENASGVTAEDRVAALVYRQDAVMECLLLLAEEIDKLREGALYQRAGDQRSRGVHRRRPGRGEPQQGHD